MRMMKLDMAYLRAGNFDPADEDFIERLINPNRVVAIDDWPWVEGACRIEIDDGRNDNRYVSVVRGTAEEIEAVWSGCMKC